MIKLRKSDGSIVDVEPYKYLVRITIKSRLGEHTTEGYINSFREKQ